MKSKFAVTHTLVALLLGGASLAAGCGGEDHDADADGCEHLEGGPYTAITAATARDGSAPGVAASHRAFTIALPAGAAGYVSFAAQEATDYLVFLDKPVPFAVFDPSLAEVSIEESVTSSPACATIRGKHTFELPVGTSVLELGPSAETSVNLVIGVAGGHDH